MSINFHMPQKSNTRFLYCIIFFIACFTLFLFFHQQQVLQIEHEKVQTHAQVISSSLWNYEEQTPSNYLSLAIATNNYLSIKVKDEYGRNFLHLQKKKLTRLETFLFTTGLIYIVKIDASIFFEGKKIGTIQTEWLCKEVYLYIYILFCIILILGTIWLFLKLLDAKHFLKSRVQKRTIALEKEIQEHKVTAKALRLQAQKLSMHVQHTPLGVVEWSPDFTVTDWNKAAETIFGFSKKEVLGKSPFTFILPQEEEKHINTVWEKLQQGSGTEISSNTNLTKDGKTKVCNWYNTILKNDAGDIIGIASLVLDITEQVETEEKNKLLQEQLLQAQKMEAVGNLAGGIAHDFNNLLQSISGYTELLLIQCKNRGENCKRLTGIKTAATRAAELVQQLLTFSRKIESNLKPLDLNQEIEQVQSVLQRTLPKMITIEKKLGPELHTINGDSVQLEQILLNLAINANHAMPDGGILTIETENTVLDSAFCAENMGAKEGKNVLLRVTDTGTGMDRDTIARIFDPFFTTKETGKGTGLGLSTVYGIINEHHAYISCSSKIGKGTCFDIYFPATKKQYQPDASSNIARRELPEGTETLLLVDDDPTIQDIGTQMLETFGYKVIIAQNGEKGFETFVKRRQEIDGILMDLNMPGMGGKQSIEKIRELDTKIPILVASGFTPPETVSDLKDLGVNTIIAKPFLLDTFIKEIRKDLDQG